MASAGGSWVKVAQGNLNTLVFVSAGQTANQAILGKKAQGGGFPTSPQDVTAIKGLGGHSGAGATLVQDANGNLYVKKQGAQNPGHLKEESAADAAYRALGVDVPEHQLYPGPVKLAKFVEGKTLASVQKNDPKAAEAAAASLRKGFAADALLANWDVVGTDFDNILIGSNGKTYRIDNGGALRYRAMGGQKASFNEYPVEIFNLRNTNVNWQMASVFGKVSGKDLVTQIGQIVKRTPAMLQTLPTALRGVMGARVTRLKQYAQIHQTLSAKGYGDKAIDGFVTKLWKGLQAGGGGFDPQTPAQIMQAFGEMGG